MTLLFCCNADGSQKFDVMVIYKLRQPRAFKKKTPAELGIDYHANSKAWMTSILFINDLSGLMRTFVVLLLAKWRYKSTTAALTALWLTCPLLMLR